MVLGRPLGHVCGIDGIFAKVGVENINSDFATLVRTLSGLATGASWICYFRALKLGDAARVAPIDKLSVVLVAVFAVVFLGERLSLPNWLGVCLIAAGAVLVAWKA